MKKFLILFIMLPSFAFSMPGGGGGAPAPKTVTPIVKPIEVVKPKSTDPLDNIPYGYNSVGKCNVSEDGRNHGTIQFYMNNVSTISNIKFKAISATNKGLKSLIGQTYTYELDGFTSLFNLGGPIFVSSNGDSKIIRSLFENSFKLIVKNNNRSANHYMVSHCNITKG